MSNRDVLDIYYLPSATAFSRVGEGMTTDANVVVHTRHEDVVGIDGPPLPKMDVGCVWT